MYAAGCPVGPNISQIPPHWLFCAWCRISIQVKGREDVYTILETFLSLTLLAGLCWTFFSPNHVHGRSCNWAGFPRWCPCCGAPTRQWAKLPPELWGTWCSSISLTSSKFSNVAALGRPCSCLRKLTPPRHKNKLQVGFFFPNLLTWSFTVFFFFSYLWK